MIIASLVFILLLIIAGIEISQKEYDFKAFILDVILYRVRL